MALTLLYLFFFFFFLQDSLDMQSKTKEQVDLYIQNIEKGESFALNTWALGEVASINCQNYTYVYNALKENIPDFLKMLPSSECSDSNLLSVSVYPLNFWRASDKELYQKIISEQLTISEAGLSINDSFLIHFKLLMGDNSTTYYSRDDLEGALPKWIELSKSIDNTDSLKYVILISLIIRTAFMVDEYSTIDQFSEYFLNQKILPNNLHKLRLLSALDYTFYIYGQYDRSLYLQRNYSMPLAEFLEEEEQLRGIKSRHGVYLFSLGKYQESLKVYEDLYDDSKTFVDQDAVFTNLGVNYLKLGQSQKYISFQLRALNEEIDDYENLLNIYRNLFIYYTSVKDINSALGYIDEARRLAQENNDPTELALIDFYLASFYWSTYNDHEEALSYLNSAAEVLSPEDNYDTYIDLLLEKGNILSKIDSLESAKEVFNQARELTLSRSDTPDYLDAIINLAIIAVEEQNFNEVETHLQEIKLYTLDDLDFQMLTKYYTLRADFSAKTGNKRKAIDELQPVIVQIIDRAKNNTDSQEGYWSVEEEYLDAFSLMIELFTGTGQDKEALALLDQLKTINDASLYNSPLVKAAKLTEEDLVEENRLNVQLQELRKEYLNANEEERFELKKQIDQTVATREQILASVNLDREKALAPIWSIQRSLNPNELLIHFTEIGTKLYVSHLTEDNLEIESFDFSTEQQQYFNSIADELSSGSTNLEHLYELYQFFGLGDIPENINQITVVPDNFLYRIPLEILPSEKPNSPISFGSSQYLIEEFSFRYFTSLKEFDNNRRSFTTETENDFAGFAISDFEDFESIDLPYLPYATIETNTVHNLLTSLPNKLIYTGDEATKEVFKYQVANSRLVHVATHSEVSEQDPLFSTIYLKSANPQDTLDSQQALYAYELFDTPLNSEFIMLNSCSSGSGNYIQGSGIVGISRALRYAGAKSLALNLWSVNDKVASEFATDFYTFINQGYSKSEAIRQAKINQLNNSNANPHFWGAYMMIGNPSPVSNKTERPYMLFGLLTFTILAAGYSTFAQTNRE